MHCHITPEYLVAVETSLNKVFYLLTLVLAFGLVYAGINFFIKISSIPD